MRKSARLRPVVLLVRADGLKPVSGIDFRNPEGLADPYYRLSGNPLAIFERVQHVLLSFAVEQVNDVPIADREMQVILEMARQR